MKKLLLIIPVLLLILCGGFVIWASIPAGPTQEAINALASDDAIQVASFPKWFAFEPQGMEPGSVVVIYPGGRVDYRSYAPSARQIAASGNLVLVVRMPLNLAVFGVNLVEEAFNAYPASKIWILGGHSLGGAMASTYVYNNPGRIDGLFLWGSYPTESNTLANTNIPVLSVSGSLDGLSTPEDIQASRQNLPAETVFVEIEGGNHAQFGSYGTQSGDNPPLISAEEQLSQLIKAMDLFIQSITKQK